MAVIRKTKTVESLIDFFKKSEHPVSILDLIEKFATTMDKSTIYRILERLEDSNMIHSFIDNDGVKRYAQLEDEESATSDEGSHPHFICNDCGISSCLPVKISIPSVPDYIIENAEHLLKGICKDCTPKIK
tara:strand:+ start:49 stop:441 length:393 start_codon:yes stop_codon:yes gene_type:complete